MSNTPGIIPYNNRFRSSSSGCYNHIQPRLQSVSAEVDMREQPSSFSYYGPQQRSSHGEQPTSSHGPSGHIHRMTSFEHPIPMSANIIPDPRVFSYDNARDPVPRPVRPGRPRRLSQQLSAEAKRQAFAAACYPAASRESPGQMVTSLDSGCDEVFVEMTGDPGPLPHTIILPDTSLFRTKSTVAMTMSTSSTASMLPNPYNRVNHRIHSAIWCCSCFYLLFFCCLPAIHYMEQSDVEYNRDNHKRARCLGKTASFMFFTGTIIALAVFALIFFFGIFFAVYD